MADSRHLKLSYPLTRSFPLHSWVNNGVFAAAFAWLILITIFNIASNGYELQLAYTTDPNTTQANRQWFNNPLFTWGQDSLTPQCQHLEIPVGYQFMTTNLGFRYTVTGIEFVQNGTFMQQRPSVSYLNNTLQNCQLGAGTIEINMRNDATEQAEYKWAAWRDSTAQLTAQCDIINDEGLFTIYFTTTYVTSQPHYTYVAVDNATTHASMWWGTRLLNAYFTGLQYVMAADATKGVPRAGIIYGQGTSQVITDDNFLGVWYWLLGSNGFTNNRDPSIATNVTGVFNNMNNLLSPVLTEGAYFSKVFLSAVMVDTGNKISSNFLLDPDMLQFVLSPDDINRQPNSPLNHGDNVLDWYKVSAISPPGQETLLQDTSVPMNKSYAEFSSMTGPLETLPASIFAQYICQVPRSKNTSTTILLVLVANYALFQAAWMVIKWAAALLVTRKDSTAMYCEGCLKYSNSNIGLKASSQHSSSVDEEKLSLISSDAQSGFL